MSNPLSVSGVFDDPDTAQTAVDALREADFHQEAIDVKRPESNGFDTLDDLGVLIATVAEDGVRLATRGLQRPGDAARQRSSTSSQVQGSAKSQRLASASK